MKALFEYKDWSVEEPDWDAVEIEPSNNLPFGPHTICPEPSCLMEDYNREDAEGPVVFSGADGEPTGIAVPCDRHSAFEFTSGWMKRFMDAEEARRVARGWERPRTCPCCQELYTEFLWGWAGMCVKCAYVQIGESAEQRRFYHV